MPSLLGLKVDIMTRALVAYVDLAIGEVANGMVSEMQGRAPKDTGTMARSIKAQKVGIMKYKVKAGGSATTKDGYDYAVGVEFGNHHAGAQPYFYPTYRAGKRNAKAKIRQAIREGVRTAVK
jgi:HK97 gp10 family phage protein